jgi:hypothetical protein
VGQDWLVVTGVVAALEVVPEEPLEELEPPLEEVEEPLEFVLLAALDIELVEVPLVLVAELVVGVLAAAVVEVVLAAAAVFAAALLAAAVFAAALLAAAVFAAVVDAALGEVVFVTVLVAATARRARLSAGS